VSLYFGFNTPEERKKRRQAQLYGISEIVTKFFWDDAPSKFHFEEREGQQEMAFEILDAIKNNQHIAVEAGVGIGKSFAYSVPLLLYCQKTSVPIVIATSTIALQEQLLKDIGRLKDLLGIQTNVILAKGQAHYLCSKRAEAYLLTPGAEMVDVIEECMKAGHHDRRSFTCAVPSAIWDKINISRFNKRSCMACAHRDYCQYYQLRDDLRYSDGITLCNQDLLTAHLFRLSRGQEGFLNTEDGIIVVDEAHNLEEKVRNATTERFGQAGILNTISAAEREVRSEEREYVQYQVTGASKAVRALFQNLNQQMKQQINDAKQDMKYASVFSFMIPVTQLTSFTRRLPPWNPSPAPYKSLAAEMHGERVAIRRQMTYRLLHSLFQHFAAHLMITLFGWSDTGITLILFSVQKTQIKSSINCISAAPLKQFLLPQR
jgi:ATP-dependent DNA helicase DinG